MSSSLVSGSGDNLILVGGEALYDLVLEGDEELRAHPGGGPFNAARTVARLGERVAYLGRLSTDRFGATLRRMLADDGVLLDAVVDTDDPTTLALAEVEQLERGDDDQRQPHQAGVREVHLVLGQLHRRGRNAVPPTSRT